jgi:hypothetical protein
MDLTYFEFFAIAMLGAFLHALFKIKSIQDKAKLAQVAFKPMDYFKEDYVSHLISITTICLALFLVKEVVKFKPEAENYLRVSFSFIGYVSNDIASRFFGAVNTRVNKIIDQKTTEADNTAGRTEPTPHK